MFCSAFLPLLLLMAGPAFKLDTSLPGRMKRLYTLSTKVKVSSPHQNNKLTMSRSQYASRVLYRRHHQVDDTYDDHIGPNSLLTDFDVWQQTNQHYAGLRNYNYPITPAVPPSLGYRGYKKSYYSKKYFAKSAVKSAFLYAMKPPRHGRYQDAHSYYDSQGISGWPLISKELLAAKALKGLVLFGLASGIHLCKYPDALSKSAFYNYLLTSTTTQSPTTQSTDRPTTSVPTTIPTTVTSTPATSPMTTTTKAPSFVGCDTTSAVVATTVGQMGVFATDPSVNGKVTGCQSIVAPAGTRLTVVCSAVSITGSKYLRIYDTDASGTKLADPPAVNTTYTTLTNRLFFETTATSADNYSCKWTVV